MYNKKVLIDSLKKLGSAKAPTQRKDMIIDPMGQWAHPGENTRIPSSRITMKGVNYPVLGISNTGQKQMMQPGKEYNFPGADYVDEYPQINSRIPKKQLGGLTRFMGSPYKMLGLAPTVPSLFNTASKINLIAKTIPKLDQSTRDLLTYPAFDVLTGETGIGSASALTKYLGDFDYKPFSEGWETLQDMKNAVDGPQWVPAAEDFYTDQEIVDLVNQQKNYNSALRDFDEMNPEAPGMEIMRALSGDTSRDELFSNLFPNASIPNFRSKILSPEQNASLNRMELQNRSFQNKAGLSTGSLKTLGVGQDILPKQYNDLLTFYKGLEWLKTTPAKDVVIEMRGLPELKGVDIENASPLQLETWRDTIVKKMEKKAIEKWKNDRGDKLTGLDAYNQLLNRSGGRNQYGGSTDFAEEPSMKKGGSPPKLPRKKNSRGYSRSLEATNRFFAEHSFFAKPKSRKNKIFDPNSRYYQPGGETDLPQNVGISYLPEGERSYYDPISDNIYLASGAGDDELNHELAHAWQNRTGNLRSNPNLPQARPPIVATNEQAATYYNRKGDDVENYLNNLQTIYPEMTGDIWTEDLNRFLPEQIKYDKVIDPLMYFDPNTMEGEAEMFSRVYGRPSGISFRQKGGELPKAQKGKATYQDSLDVYNNALKQQAFYNKLAPYYGSIRTYSDYSFDIDRAKETQRETLAYKTPNYWTPQEISNFKKTKNIIKANKDPNIAYLTDIITGALDPNAPPLRYDARIKPQGIKSYYPYFAEYTPKELAIIDKIDKKLHTVLLSYDGKNFIGTRKEILEKTKKLGYTEKEIIPILSKAKKNNEAHDKIKGFITDIPYYDPIAVKPGKLLTDDEIIKRVKKYGTDGIPEYRLKKLNIKDTPPSQPKIKINPEEVGTFVSKKQPCVPKTTVVNNVPEKIPFGKKLVGTTSTTSPVTSTNKCEYIETINPVYEDIKVERMDFPEPQLVTEDPMGSIQGIQADPLVPPQYIMEDYKGNRPDINIDWSNQKSIDYNLPKYHKNWMQTAAPPFHGTKKHSIEYKLPTGLDVSSKEKTRLFPKLVQKLTGYDPEYMEGYEDEEGNYIPGAIELANQTGSELEFKGAASLRDFINQQQYKKDYAVYQEGLDKRNQDKRMAETLSKMYAKGLYGFKYGGLSKFLEGGPQCPKDYTYNPETKRCEKKSGCPEGYFWDNQEGRCKSKAYREKSQLYSKGNKIVPTKEQEKYSWWPDDLTIKHLNPNTALIHPSKRLEIYKPGVTDFSNEWSPALFPIYPDLNYEVIVDPSKPKGYNADKSIYYVPDENNLEFEKFKQYKKLKEVEKENLENLSRYPEITTNIINEDWGDKNSDPDYFQNPNTADPDDQIAYDDYINSKKNKYEECTDCSYGHGETFSYDDGYKNTEQNLSHVYNKFYEIPDYQTKFEKEYDYADPLIESVIPELGLEEYDEESPIYRKENPGMLIPHVRVTDGKTKTKKHRGRLFDGKGQKYKYTTHYQTKDLDFGRHEVNRPIPALVQKLTGYDPKYMLGYDEEVDGETVHIPGEIERAEQEGRRINFKGATTLGDLKQQKEYQKQWEDHEKNKASVRQRNEDYLKEYNITPEEYAQYYGSFRQGGYLPKAQYGDGNYGELYSSNNKPQIYGHEPEDYSAFLAYSETAPENRRPDETYFYGDPNNYDHYGMWEALGKPQDFQQALEINPDWQPDPYDGYYHGFSVNPNTGIFLKSGKPGLKSGDTTWMEIAGHYLSPRAQVDTPVFDPELGRFKYIPNEEDGGFMDIELDDEEIEQYAKGGYIVEDISIPSLIGKYQGGGAKKAIKTLSNFLSKEKSFIKPTVNDLNYKPGLIEIRNFALPGMPKIDKPYELYSVDLPDRLIPGRDYEDVKHKLSDLRRDLKIPYLEHLANKYIPGFAKEIPMREAANSVHPTTGQLWDSNTRYWLNREYGITPEIGFTDLGMATRMAKNYGTLISKSDKPFGTGHNYVHTLPGPAAPIRIHNPYDITLSNPFADKSPIDEYKNGGQYELGDEIDEATMKQLKKLGYTFEKI